MYRTKKLLKVSRGKDHVTHKGKPFRITLPFSMENESPKARTDALQAQRDHRASLEHCTQQNYHNQERGKTAHSKNKFKRVLSTRQAL